MYLFKFHQSLCWRCNCMLQLAAAVVGNGSSTAELFEAVQRGSFGCTQLPGSAGGYFCMCGRQC